RGLPPARGATPRKETRRPQPAQQIVGFALAAEEQVLFVRLERAQAWGGVKQTSPARDTGPADRERRHPPAEPPALHACESVLFRGCARRSTQPPPAAPVWCGRSRSPSALRAV